MADNHKDSPNRICHDKEVVTILEKAMNMSQQQRAFIAEQLIESLETKTDNDTSLIYKEAYF